MESTHPLRAAFHAALPGAREAVFEFRDLDDANLAALSGYPERLIEAARSGQTSFFERMRRDHAQELEEGIARIKEDIATGRIPRHAGTATVLSWTKPG
jgi:hypothetical protein